MKWAKYVIETAPAPPADAPQGAPPSVGGLKALLVNNGADGTVPDAPYLNAELVTHPTPVGPFQQHAHSFDEYITFIGTNLAKAYELDGAVEMWIEDEKYVLTKPTAVLVPKGVYHGPVVFHRVDSPILWVESAAATYYSYGMM
jgi:hypothetical protein